MSALEDLKQVGALTEPQAQANGQSRTESQRNYPEAASESLHASADRRTGDRFSPDPMGLSDRYRLAVPTRSSR